MKIPCPVCGIEINLEHRDCCAHCGAEVASLRQVLLSASDSVRLGLESLKEGRDREAMDYAYEAWGLMHTTETAALGLLVAAKLNDGTETTRWLKRRRGMQEQLESEEES